MSNCLVVFSHQHPSSRRSTTWALRWWSRAAPWCRPGPIWPSWFTLWTTAARTRSDCQVTRCLSTSPPPSSLPATFIRWNGSTLARTPPPPQILATDWEVSFWRTCDFKEVFGSGRVFGWWLSPHSPFPEGSCRSDRRSGERHCLKSLSEALDFCFIFLFSGSPIDHIAFYCAINKTTGWHSGEGGVLH